MSGEAHNVSMKKKQKNIHIHQIKNKLFWDTYWKALCDGNLNIEEQDSGSESSTDSNRLLGITEHTADTVGKQNNKQAECFEVRTYIKICMSPHSPKK